MSILFSTWALPHQLTLFLKVINMHEVGKELVDISTLIIEACAIAPGGPEHTQKLRERMVKIYIVFHCSFSCNHTHTLSLYIYIDTHVHTYIRTRVCVCA